MNCRCKYLHFIKMLKSDSKSFIQRVKRVIYKILSRLIIQRTKLNAKDRLKDTTKEYVSYKQ